MYVKEIRFVRVGVLKLKSNKRVFNWSTFHVAFELTVSR